MNIRLAQTKDIDKTNSLLCQVLDVHHNGRPDLFKGGVKKYTDAELTISQSIYISKFRIFFLAANVVIYLCF